MQPFLYRFANALLLTTICGFAAAEKLHSTRDWEQVGSVARRRGMPIVIVINGHGCGHCERMKREFLSDPSIQGFLRTRALVRIYDERTGGKITDFDGERLRARMFLARYTIFATPTLLFLDPDGRPLADPLVGYNDAINYRDLLTGRLDLAQLALDAGEGRSAPVLVTEQP